MPCAYLTAVIRDSHCAFECPIGDARNLYENGGITSLSARSEKIRRTHGELIYFYDYYFCANARAVIRCAGQPVLSVHTICCHLPIRPSAGPVILRVIFKLFSGRTTCRSPTFNKCVLNYDFTLLFLRSLCHIAAQPRRNDDNVQLEYFRGDIEKNKCSAGLVQIRRCSRKKQPDKNNGVAFQGIQI